MKYFIYLLVVINTTLFNSSEAQSIFNKIKNKVNKEVKKVTEPSQGNSTQQNSGTTPNNSASNQSSQNNNNSTTNNSSINQKQNVELNLNNNSPIRIIPNNAPYWNYADDPVVFNNALYVRFSDNIVRCDGDNLTVIDKPNNTSNYIGFPIIYNNQLYLKYETNGIPFLAVYDGNKINILKKSYGDDEFQFNKDVQPIVCGNYLYYLGNATKTKEGEVLPAIQLLKFDGQNQVLVSFPANYFMVDEQFTSFQNKLYFTAAVPYVVEYDGTKFNAISNTSKQPIINVQDIVSGDGIYLGPPSIYHNKLAGIYRDLANRTTLGMFEYDGKKVIIIPSNISSNKQYTLVKLKDPIIFNNKLYLNYSGQLLQYDGNKLSFINGVYQNKDSSYTGFPIVYNDKLYMQFEVVKNSTAYPVLAQYDGTTLSFIDNPKDKDNHEMSYQGSPIVFNNKLYLKYNVNGSMVSYLAEYDGTNLVLIDNQTFKDQGSSQISAIFYSGSPFIFNNRLYLHCESWLGYISDSSSK